MTGTQRLGLVLTGTLIASIGHTQLDPRPGTPLVIVGATICLLALGLLDLSAHLWHLTRRPNTQR